MKSKKQYRRPVLEALTEKLGFDSDKETVKFLCRLCWKEKIMDVCKKYNISHPSLYRWALDFGYSLKFKVVVRAKQGPPLIFGKGKK